MKKRLISIALIIVFLCTFSLNASAADMINDSTKEKVNQLPTTNNTLDTYTFDIPSTSFETILPVKVEEKGVLFFGIAPQDEATIYEFMNSKVKPEMIAGLYKDEACTPGNLIKSKVCINDESLGEYIFTLKMEQTGDYYLKLTLKNCTEQKKRSFTISPYNITNTVKNIENDKPIYTIALTSDPGYYKVEVDKEGLLGVTAIDILGNASYKITLLDANKKAISKAMDPTNDPNNINLYAVKKGIYYYKVEAQGTLSYCAYAIASIYEESDDIFYAINKRDALTIKLGKAKEGILFANNNTSSWYKFSVTRSKKVTLELKSAVNSGSLKLEVYDANNKKVSFQSSKKLVQEDELYMTLSKNVSSRNLKAGTYYVKVSKSNNFVSGVFEITAK